MDKIELNRDMENNVDKAQTYKTSAFRVSTDVVKKFNLFFKRDNLSKDRVSTHGVAKQNKK